MHRYDLQNGDIMKRVMLTVAYDGTAYHGWQVQQNGVTIEGELNRVIHELTGEDIQVIGASRTDAGVHGLCNIAVFDTNSSIPGEKFSYALNQRLPDDIKVVASCEVEDDFHPRHVPSKKTYEYKVYNAKFPDPTKRLYSHFTYVPLDVERMQKAASYLVGEHDFKSFCSPAAVVETTVRTLYKAEVTQDEEYIRIRVQGNGFLYNMVRIIAGTLMEVGSGKLEPEAIVEILEAKDRNAAGPTAPAKGLMLINYEFTGKTC